jgi:hypothetical protein
MDVDGNDLLFITGAPGSRWSAVAYALSFADRIDSSDGGDFGPRMELGNERRELDHLGKPEILERLHAPYAQPGGIKLVKGRFVSRYLDTLRDLFPEARFVLVHRPDDKCFDGWLEAGGFSLNFPDYSWYQELDHMRAQIAQDNGAILDFAARHGARFKRYRTSSSLLKALGLSYSEETIQQRGESELDLHGCVRSAQIAFL